MNSSAERISNDAGSNVLNAITRDERYKQILHEQLGQNGIIFLANQSILFVLAIIMIIGALIGFLCMHNKSTTLKLTTPIVVPQHGL